MLITGDYKFDQTPVDGQPGRRRRAWPSSAARACCCCAATRRTSTAPGFSPVASRGVGPHLEEVFSRCEGRIVVTSFASNIHRVQQVVDAAAALGRKVALVGRSMRKNVNIGALARPHRGARGRCSSRPREIDDFPDHKLVIISTGLPGRAAVSALRRMAHRDHPQVELHDGRHGRLLRHADPGQRARGQRDDRPALPHRLRRDHDRATRRSTPPATATPRRSS